MSALCLAVTEKKEQQTQVSCMALIKKTQQTAEVLIAVIANIHVVAAH